MLPDKKPIDGCILWAKRKDSALDLKEGGKMIGYLFELVMGLLYSLDPERLWEVSARQVVFWGYQRRHDLDSVFGAWQCDCPAGRIYADTYPMAQCRHAIAVRRLWKAMHDGTVRVRKGVLAR